MEKKYVDEEVLKMAATLSEEKILKRNFEDLKRSEEIDELFPMLEPDQEFLEFARKYDKKRKKNNCKQNFKHVSQIAAIFLVCIVTMTTIALETSDAFRVRFYSIFENESDGSVALLPEQEADLIGDWKDYWYPSFVPEGFQMIDAEQSGTDKIMLFEKNDKTAELRIMEMPLDTAIGVDIETNEMEEIRVGYYKGYLFIDEENQSVKMFWLTDDRQIEIRGDGELKKEDLMKIAEGLEHRKEKK